MAWDLALAHPDLFAGAVVISGLPAKYVPRYLPHHERMPLFFVIGDLAPAANEFVFAKYIKPLIQKTWDITYVEYYRRGLETLPEEIGPAFDWMDRHRRDPYPKSFKVNTARVSDDRFYGVVIREFDAGCTTDPRAVEMLGSNLKPATIEMKSSTLSNLIRLDNVRGVTWLDIWLSPKLIDFKRKADIRINGKPVQPPGQDQAGNGTDARRPQGARRPEAALLAPDQHPMTIAPSKPRFRPLAVRRHIDRLNASSRPARRRS